MKNIVLIVPHTKKRQGAASPEGLTEYSWGSELLPLLAKELNKNKNICAKVYNRDKGFNYIVDQVVKDFREMPVLSFENHFNDALSPYAYGCEMLVQEDDKETIYKSFDFMFDFAEEYSFKKRHDQGVKKINDDDAGNYNLIQAEKFSTHHVLFEPFFIQSDDAKIILNDPDRYVSVVSKLIIKHFLDIKPEKKVSIIEKIFGWLKSLLS